MRVRSLVVYFFHFSPRIPEVESFPGDFCGSEVFFIDQCATFEIGADHFLDKTFHSHL